ncbi:hypothetical protein PGB90_007146 [Kerria lacca]
MIKQPDIKPTVHNHPLYIVKIGCPGTLLRFDIRISLEWDAVTASTIRHCFQKGGFTDTDDTIYHEECLPNFEDVSKEEFNTWLTVEDNVPTAGVLTEEEICANIVNRHQLQEYEDDDYDDADILPSPPTCQEMMRALDVLRKGVQQYGETFEEHFQYERYRARLLSTTEHQTKIKTFFPNNHSVNRLKVAGLKVTALS